MIELLVGRKRPPVIYSQDSDVAWIELDACISQNHSYKNQVTKYPVESGVDITDHVRQEPDRLKIEGHITNTPVRWLNGLFSRNVAGNSGADRVISAYESLLLVSGRKVTKTGDTITTSQFSKPLLVDIVVRYRVFTDMIMESLEFPFDDKTGDAIEFSAEFVKIRKAITTDATVNYTNGKKYGSGGAEDQLEVKNNKGNQATTTPLDKRFSGLMAAQQGGGIIGAFSQMLHL